MVKVNKNSRPISFVTYHWSFEIAIFKIATFAMKFTYAIYNFFFGVLLNTFILIAIN